MQNSEPELAPSSAFLPVSAPVRKGKKLSDHKGVYWNKKSQKWRVQFFIRGKNVYLGNFATEAEAAREARAFDLKRESHFGPSPTPLVRATKHAPELSYELDTRRKRVACKIERLKAEVKLAKAEEEFVSEQGPNKQRRTIKRLRLQVELAKAEEELLA